MSDIKIGSVASLSHTSLHFSSVASFSLLLVSLSLSLSVFFF